jgi:hypothetical protein
MNLSQPELRTEDIILAAHEHALQLEVRPLRIAPRYVRRAYAHNRLVVGVGVRQQRAGPGAPLCGIYRLQQLYKIQN